MTETRNPLGSLGSEMNVGGEEYLRRRAGPELTAVDRQIRRMRERRQETWRPLTRQRVVAFFQLFLNCVVWTENGDREGRPHPEVTEALLGALVNKIIPWVDQHRIRSRFECRWPMTLEQFHEVDNELELYLPRIYRAPAWQRICVYFGDMEREREERRREEWERRQMEVRLNQVRRILFP